MEQILLSWVILLVLVTWMYLITGDLCHQHLPSSLTFPPFIFSLSLNPLHILKELVHPARTLHLPPPPLIHPFFVVYCISPLTPPTIHFTAGLPLMNYNPVHLNRQQGLQGALPLNLLAQLNLKLLFRWWKTAYVSFCAIFTFSLWSTSANLCPLMTF